MNILCFCPCALFMLLVAGPVVAAVNPARLCDQAAQSAAQKTGVPIDILLAITRVETGRSANGELQPWPWAINADGTGAWFDTQAQAVAAATAHLADGTGTFDVGCFQLNMRWHGNAFASLSEMLDPGKNADYAARFLLQLYQESGDWARAVADYHSRTGDLAAAYVEKVKAVLNGPAVPDISPLQPQPRENNFPLLQAGDRGSAGSIVPLQTARGPLIGGGA